MIAVLSLDSDVPMLRAQGASSFIVRTIAGSGPPDVRDGAQATIAFLESPETVLAAPDGSLYIVDTGNHRIRRVDPAGIISTIAGIGSAENQDLGDDGPATAATLRFPRGVALAPDGSLYIADSNHYVVRRVDPNGIITRVAGSRNFVYSGDGGPALQAGISFPISVAVDGSGNLYIADQLAHRVRRVDRQGIIRTIAGTGESGTSGDGGAATEARLQSPRGLWLHDRTRLMVATTTAIRVVDLTTGGISTAATLGASGLVVDGSSAFIFGSGTVVRRFDPRNGQTETLASGLNDVRGVGVDTTGRVYVAETGAHRILRNGRADGGPAVNAVFTGARGLVLDSDGMLYVADWLAHRIRRVTPGRDGVFTGEADEIITTYAGNGTSNIGSDGQSAFGGPLGSPLRIGFDPDGHLFVYQETNDGNRRIRRLDRQTGVRSTVLAREFVGDMRFIVPGELWVARSTEVMALDLRSGRFERIAGRSTAGFGGDGGPVSQALFRGVGYFTGRPGGGAVFVDNGNYRLRAFLPASQATR